MRTSRPPITINGITWDVTWVVPDSFVRLAADPFQGIEFRCGAMVRRIALSRDEMPSVEEFRAMTPEELAGLLSRAEAAWPSG